MIHTAGHFQKSTENYTAYLLAIVITSDKQCPQLVTVVGILLEPRSQGFMST